MQTGKKEVRLCDFNKIELSVPRLKLVKCLFKKGFLSEEETIFLRALDWRAESVENKILHVRSLARKALLKSGSAKT